MNMHVRGTARFRTAASEHSARATPSSAKALDQRYLANIGRFEMLESDVEYALAVSWRDHGDQAAADRLVTAHLRLAAKIATSFRGYGLPIADLMSEANLGLINAVKRFDPDKGARFSTYATWWIRAAIQEYVLRTWSLVKINGTGTHKRLFFKLRSTMKGEAAFHDGLRGDQAAHLAKTLRVCVGDVLEMDQRLRGDTSLNAPMGSNGQPGEWQDMLVDETPTPEAIVLARSEDDRRRRALADAASRLDPRERLVFEKRFLVEAPVTRRLLAAELNVCKERIRQIEVTVLRKLRETICGDGRSRGAAVPFVK
jgi:RNA polymerase sigma-32 factor